MHRFGDTGGIKKDAVIALVLGVVAAAFVQGPCVVTDTGVQCFPGLGLGGGAIFQTLIVVAVAGLWYHWRRVL